MKDLLLKPKILKLKMLRPKTMINVKCSKFENVEADITIVPVVADLQIHHATELDVSLEPCRTTAQAIQENQSAMGFPYLNAKMKNGKWGADVGNTLHYGCFEKGEREILFLGLGEAKCLCTDDIRTAFAMAVKEIRKLGSRRIFVLTDVFAGGKSMTALMGAAFEGLCLGDYKFEKYKSEKDEKGLLEVSFAGMDSKNMATIEEAAILSEATLFARNLVNEPPNILYPESLGEAAISSAREHGYDAEVFDKQKIEEFGMEAFLSVGKGSAREPKLIVLRYFGEKRKDAAILGLVGKGITFDSGGNNLKPTEAMLKMKSDMAGAASVIGAMNAIAKKKLKVNVVSVIAAAENIISGNAYRPGDIIGTMAGKTVEIGNTDAEGRLTLADAIFYAITKEKATCVIDVATLTGAVLVALGSVATAAVTNEKSFFERYEKAAERSDEKVWLLPSYDKYKDALKSDVADYKNVGGKEAGVITGGLFVGEFAERTPWIHLDIAGTAWSDDEKGYLSKGGTGVCVRSLYY
ncbi:MAG: leucyl aminopeptidase, partial [Clostridiales bacterium]|nr:leucyl aminopeptidase [Clostridiales bacterium]